MDSRQTFALVLALLHGVSLFGASAVYDWMRTRKLAPRHLVAGGATPPPSLMQLARREVAFGLLVFGALCYFAVYPLWIVRGGTMLGPVPSAWTFVLSFGAFVLINDTVFYFSHRALHTRWLYKHVHARHHRFRFVRGLSAEYAHPLENAANLAAFFAGPVLLGSHFAVVASWVFFRMLETVDAHSGYAFTPWADRHAFHHMYAARGCYGSFAGLWDRVLGTERQWRAWRAEGSPIPRSAQHEDAR